MVQVVLSFDTEDYAFPPSDDAIVRLADLLTEEGVKGCFNVVGELAGELVRRGRRDVIERLKRHEVNYHSMFHSWHPTMVEYTDTENWQEGFERFRERESGGIRIVKEVFGQEDIIAFVPPGNTIASQAIHGFRELGVPVYSGSLFKKTGGRGIWYCNALNLENNCYIDPMLLDEGADGFRRRLEEYSRLERLIVCCHPNIIPYRQFWDELNMKGANLVEWGEWIEPERRTDAEREQYYADFRSVVRMLKADPRFEFVTYADIWTREKPQERRTLPLDLLLRLIERTKAHFFYQERDGASYSLADLFHASAHYLCGGSEPYGTVHLVGPLYEPVGVAAETEVAAEQIRHAASRLAASREIPARIALGPDDSGREAGTSIGPRDFMEAAAQALAGATRITLAPKPQMPDTTDFYGMNDFRLVGTWMNAPDFPDQWVTRRLKWQAWTIRGESRK